MLRRKMLRSEIRTWNTNHSTLIPPILTQKLLRTWPRKEVTSAVPEVDNEVVKEVNVMVKRRTEALEEEAMDQITSNLATTAKQIGMNLFLVWEETQIDAEVVITIAALNTDTRPKMKLTLLPKQIKSLTTKSKKRRKVTKTALIQPRLKTAGIKGRGIQISLKNASATKTWSTLKRRTWWSRR